MGNRVLATLGENYIRPAHTVDVLAADKHRLALLVVPPNTDPRGPLCFARTVS
jgi:hypothetical protein